MENCLICTRIDLIKQNKNPFFVCELKSGYVVVGDHQYLKGYTLFLSKNHVSELHELNKETKKVFLEEMALVAEAVYRVYKPIKLNYELLGNTERHLHWHIVPRYGTDPAPRSPIWVVDKAIRDAKETKPSKEYLLKATQELKEEIKRLSS